MVPFTFSSRPGDYVRDEMLTRGWTIAQLATHAGAPEFVIRQVLANLRPITPEIAAQLGKAFGTSAGLWTNLEHAYRR